VIADRTAALRAVREALDDYGLLLLSDPDVPSVVGIIVGEPVRGSWWAHPLGGVIYDVSSTLEDDAAVLATKLVDGKVTYVHYRLWPAVFSVGRARESWQTDGLSQTARWLLDETDANGTIQTNDLSPRRKDVPQAARELERRLLVHATEIHTATGAHAKVLETWPSWAKRVDFGLPRLSVTHAKVQLKDAVARLGGAGALPFA
jgi:hypothetical protein